MDWKLPEEIGESEVEYLQKKVYPNLSVAVLSVLFFNRIINITINKYLFFKVDQQFNRNKRASKLYEGKKKTILLGYDDRKRKNPK